MIHILKERVYGLLRFSERYTKTDMIYLTKGGFWLGLGQAISSLSSLALAVILANYISPNVYGSYKFVLALIGLISSFSLLGMGTALVRSISQGFEGSLKQGVRLSLVWNSGIVLMAGTAALYFFLVDNTVLALSLLVAGTLSPPLLSFALYSSYLEGKKLFRAEALISSARTILVSVTLAAVAILFGDYLALVVAYYVCNVILVVLGLWITLRFFSPSNTRTEPTLSNHAKHFSLIAILSKIGGNLDKVLLFSLLGPASVATYTIALAPIYQAESMRGILARLALPKLSNRPYRELRTALPQKSVFLLILSALLTFTYIGVAPALFDVLFPQYLDAVAYTQVAALSLLFAPTLLFSEAFSAHVMKRELYAIKTISAVSSVLLLLTLTPLLGVWGAIVSLLVSQTVTLLLHVLFFYRPLTKF